MSDKLKKILRLALLAVFIVSTVLLVWEMVQNSGADASYEEALRIATASQTASDKPAPSVQTTPSEPTSDPSQPDNTEPEPVWVPAPLEEEDPAIARLEKIDLKALQDTNPDVLGWILIPGTQINYPLLQGQDNEFYPKHTWEGKANSAGSVFLECGNSPDFSDFNSILYAHNMRNGSMFATVVRYQGQWQADNAPYIYIATNQGIWRYRVFAAFKAPIDSQVYGLSYQQEETRQKLIDLALEKSVIESDIIPATTDRILTLSTCTGRGYDSRYVVMAMLPMIRQDNAEAQTAP